MSLTSLPSTISKSYYNGEINEVNRGHDIIIREHKFIFKATNVLICAHALKKIPLISARPYRFELQM